jgi:integrase
MDIAYIFQDDGNYIIRISPSRDSSRLRWRVDAYYRGNRKDTRACSVFSSQEDARACAAVLWNDYISGLHHRPDAPPATVTVLVERFLARTEGKRGRTLSAATTRAYRTQLKPLVTLVGADCPLHHLGRRHLEAYVRLPPSPRSREQYLRAGKAMIRWAIAQHWLEVDVSEGVYVDPGPTIMRPFLQPEEVEPFLAACTASHRIRAGFILETGLRAAEAVNLRWDWITRGIGRPTLRVPGADPVTGFQAKARRARPIPLSTRAQEFLAEAREQWGSQGFVLHGHDTAIRTDNWCADTHAACRKGGVTDTDTHGLRRTAGVLWIAAGLDIYLVSRLLGHASVTTTERHYAGIADSRLAGAFDGVDARATLPSVPTPTIRRK